MEEDLEMRPQIKESFCVRVICMTYNQSKYIEETMNGFCMQQTNFPFLCTIFDDNSTDGEQEVIKKYLDTHFIMDNDAIMVRDETDDYTLIYTKHKTNTNCFFAVYFLKYNHYQLKKNRAQYLFTEWQDIKYLAICEGDDYWIDPLKLQKQVDFLESHPDYVLCFHKVKVLLANKGILVDDFITHDSPKESSFSDLASKGNYIHTPSVVYRNIPEVKKELEKLGPITIGDYVTYLLLAQYGKIRKLDDIMAVYRYGVGVWSGNENEFNKKLRMYHDISKVSVVVRDCFKSEIYDLVNKREHICLDMYNGKKNDIITILNSPSYKLGHFVLYPLIWLKRIIKGL